MMHEPDLLPYIFHFNDLTTMAYYHNLYIFFQPFPQTVLIQLRAKQTAPIVNEYYENEVTLRQPN